MEASPDKLPPIYGLAIMVGMFLLIIPCVIKSGVIKNYRMLLRHYRANRRFSFREVRKKFPGIYGQSISIGTQDTEWGGWYLIPFPDGLHIRFNCSWVVSSVLVPWEAMKIEAGNTMKVLGITLPARTVLRITCPEGEVPIWIGNDEIILNYVKEKGIKTQSN